MATTSRTARSGFNRIEILVVVVIVGILAAVLFPPITGPSRPYKPPAIPDRDPIEERRVYLPIGISIVRPPGWEVVIRREDDWSAGVIALNYPEPFSASLEVRWSPTKPEIPVDANEISFQGRPAHLKIERQAPNPWFFGSVRRAGGQRESRGYLLANLVARRGARWISIEFSCYGDHPEIPPMIWKYLETLDGPTPESAAESREDPPCR